LREDLVRNCFVRVPCCHCNVLHNHSELVSETQDDLRAKSHWFCYSSSNRNKENSGTVTRKHMSPKRWAQPLHSCSYPTFDRIHSDDLVLATQEYMSQSAGLNLRTLTDLQPLTRSTQLVSEDAKVARFADCQSKRRRGPSE
jgi:hypothetical protein